MAKQAENNIRLGGFVFAGLLALIFTLYMIGRNRNLFGSNFELKARFSNVSGLVEGGNVLFSGIQAGTVKSIVIQDDTTIEVFMLIDKKIKPFIHKNAVAAIGTQGLIGDKIINISPGRGASPNVADDDEIATKRIVNTDEMLETLSKTNNNMADISEGLKNTVLKVNSSSIWSLINDSTLKRSIQSTLNNIDQASINAREMARGLNDLVAGIKNGKGSVGILLKDTTFAGNLNDAALKIKSASDNANNLTIQLNQIVKEVNRDLKKGKGSIALMLKDSVTARNLSISMENVRKGTDGFNQNMEALKHNFLLRGYFKKLEKQHKSNATKQDTTLKK
ncbi:MAG TPA: MlaD family protein [Mucilaginibacter sp.]|jgi:phospholipid/cholesterol/gamma-HCH transport system substrate-binding protein|nr:MlaD family protein [Mucilaginibacter sp.]